MMRSDKSSESTGLTFQFRVCLFLFGTLYFIFLSLFPDLNQPVSCQCIFVCWPFFPTFAFGLTQAAEREKNSPSDHLYWGEGKMILSLSLSLSLSFSLSHSHCISLTLLLLQVLCTFQFNWPVICAMFHFIVANSSVQREKRERRMSAV